MSFSQFFGILWARRWVVFISTVACFLAAVLVGLIIPPRYEARARLIFENFKPDPITGEVMSSQFARAYVSTQIELIKDNRTAGRVVDNLKWASNPDLVAAYNARSPDDGRGIREWLASRVSGSTDAKLVPGSNILEITYTSNNPQGAAFVAETIRASYIDQAVASKRTDALSNAGWLQTQVARLRSELTTAQSKKTAFERANGIVLQDDNTDTDTARLVAMTGAAAMVGAVPGMAMAPGGSPVAAQLAQVDAQIANAAKLLGPNHPDLQAMRRQRDALAASGNAGQPRVVTNSGPSVAQQYSQQQQKVLASRGKVAQAQQLAADVQVLREQYAKTSARAAELQQQGEAQDAGLTTLGVATIPTSPSFPNWPLIIFGSLAAGAALGVVAGLALELADRRVRGVGDLEYMGVPVMGMMVKPQRGRLRFFNRFNLLARAQNF